MKTADWQRLQDLLDPFEEAWHAAADGPGSAVELERFLPPPGDALRLVALHELVKADLEFRWRHAQPALLESYLDRFPELGPARSLDARLIYEEYRVRRRHGGHPTLSEYQARFPDQFPELQRLLEREPVSTLAGTLHTPTRVPATPPREPAANPLQPGQASYRRLGRIGVGAFGEVWRAEAPGGVPVALKTIIRPIQHELAQQELHALELIKQLRHSFLMAVQAFWVQDDRLHIVMELADKSLRQRLAECRQQGLPGVPRDELLGYFREAAEALDYLHAEKVLHRDVKPENLLLLGGHVKVADFGLVRVYQTQQSLLQDSGSGTPAYMAPEMVTKQVSRHSDQYSLAVAYAELRLGRLPFIADTILDLLQAHLHVAPNLKGLPEAEQAVLRKALAKRHRQRYRSCTEFAAALTEAAAPERAPAGARQAGRGCWLWAALLLLVFGATLGGLFASGWFTPTPTPEVVMRADWERPADAQVVADPTTGKHYCDRIDVVRDGVAVPFVLVLHKEDGNPHDPPTFYIMQDKVWAGLFRQFAAAHPERLTSQKWQKDPSSNAEDDYPVLGVVVNDAFECSRWLGGHLPTIQQWTKATGFYEKDRGDGPFRRPEHGPPRLAIGGRLMKRTEDTDDVSFCGCRHMAGNGKEFTRNLAVPNGEMVPLTKPDSLDAVMLRGWSFTKMKPLLFEHLEVKNQDHLEDQPYLDVDPETGFRVVIEP